VRDSHSFIDQGNLIDSSLIRFTDYGYTLVGSFAALILSKFFKGLRMSELLSDQILRGRSFDLMAQYEELIRLRKEVARLINPLKTSPIRKRLGPDKNRLLGRRSDRAQSRRPVF
jgi:hypothetical protein